MHLMSMTYTDAAWVRSLSEQRVWFPTLHGCEEDLYQAAWASLLGNGRPVHDPENYLAAAVYSAGLKGLRRRRRRPVVSLSIARLKNLTPAHQFRDCGALTLRTRPRSVCRSHDADGTTEGNKLSTRAGADPRAGRALRPDARCLGVVPVRQRPGRQGACAARRRPRRAVGGARDARRPGPAVRAGADRRPAQPLPSERGAIPRASAQHRRRDRPRERSAAVRGRCDVPRR